MALLRSLFRRKKDEVEFDPEPGEMKRMPDRPYRILYANLAFFSDAKCEKTIEGATLVILRCEDPRQKHMPIEYMPTTKNYKAGELVNWNLNNKKLWESAFFRNPQTGKIEKAWSQAVEFIGKVVRNEEKPGAAGQASSQSSSIAGASS